jgi:hypothetical protein
VNDEGFGKQLLPVTLEPGDHRFVALELVSGAPWPSPSNNARADDRMARFGLTLDSTRRDAEY